MIVATDLYQPEPNVYRAMAAHTSQSKTTSHIEVDIKALADALRRLPGYLVTLTGGIAPNLTDDELWLAAGRKRARIPAVIRSGDTGVRLTTDRRDLLDALDGMQSLNVGDGRITLQWSAVLPALAQA